MKVLALLSQKGGAGKTTLAVHLAVHAHLSGERVALIDIDPQRSAGDWWRAREDKMPALAECHPRHLVDALNQAASRSIAVTILDTPPQAGPVAEMVAGLAGLSLIPCRPSPIDLRSTQRTVEIVKKAKARAGIVLNACPLARREGTEPSITREARQGVAEFDIPVAPVIISHQAALSHPTMDGRTYIEVFRDGRAAYEIGELWAWLVYMVRDADYQPSS